jgi:hypothetical protein
VQGGDVRNTTRWAAGILTAAATVVLATTAPAGAAATTTLADWRLNEGPGATTMQDSSGNNIDGVIGSAVQTGVGFGDGTTGYRWSNVKPNEPPAKPERLIQISDSRLNPGTRDYAVSFRYRTTRPFGNIMQKGQATTPGGQFKFQLPKGNVTCLFRGSAGRRAVRSTGFYNDGQWHTVRCERTAAGITMTIRDANDALQETRKISGATGTLANNIPMTIGGKVNCDQIEITCDYFAGDIDWIKIETS